MQFEAKVVWETGSQDFLGQRYSRAHEWQFDGGLCVPASSSPLSVPLPMSNPANIDPEEALVAAVSSCHMLFFLSLAAKSGFSVDHYSDHALGKLCKNAEHKMALTIITLRPRVIFSGATQPDTQQQAAMHHAAHELCYIANSLKTDVRVEAVAS